MVSYTFTVPSFSSIKTILRDSFPVGIASALILLYLNFDTILLGFYVDNASLGFYSAAFKIYYFGYSFLTLYYIAFLPSLSKKDDDRYDMIRNSYIRLLFLLASVLVLIGIFLSEYVILFLFGEHYHEANPVMMILFFSLAAACINFAFMNPLQAIGKDALFNRILAFRTVFFVLFCFIMIPTYGIMGAAYSTFIAEIVTIPVSAYFLKNASTRHV
jgi:O-antigen/teichoic acid export membrane protein